MKSRELRYLLGFCVAITLSLTSRVHASPTTAPTWHIPQNGNETLTNPSFLAFSPEASTDDLGNSVAAWTWKNPATDEVRIQFAEKIHGVWHKPAITGLGAADKYFLSNKGDYADLPRVATGANFSDAAVVWRQCKGKQFSQFRIFIAERHNGKWIKPKNVNESLSLPVSKAEAPSIAMNNQGAMIVAWQQIDPADGKSKIFSAYRKGGSFIYQSGQWKYQLGKWLQKPVAVDSAHALSASSLGDAYWPEVAIDSEGDAVMTWYQYASTQANPDTVRVYHRRFSQKNNSWGPAIQLSQHKKGLQLWPMIASSKAADQFAIIWAGEYNLSWGTTHTFLATQGLSGTPPATVAEFSSPNQFKPLSLKNESSVCSADFYDPPRVAINRNGNLVATWSQRSHQNNFNQSSIFIAELRDGNWSQPKAFSDAISPQDSVTLARNPVVGIDESGYTAIAWAQADQYGKQQLYMAETEKNAAGQTEWIKPFDTANITGPAEGYTVLDPKISLNAHGAGTLIWGKSSMKQDQSVLYIGERY